MKSKFVPILLLLTIYSFQASACEEAYTLATPQRQRSSIEFKVLTTNPDGRETPILSDAFGDGNTIAMTPPYIQQQQYGSLLITSSQHSQQQRSCIYRNKKVLCICSAICFCILIIGGGTVSYFYFTNNDGA